MKCKSCDKEIVFLKTKNGKNIPVNRETIQGKETVFDVAKGHVPHFADCPQSKEWRKDRSGQR